MKFKYSLICLFSFCIFISFQSKKNSPTIEELNALVRQRIKQADTTNYQLLEKTIEEVKPYFSTETEVLALLYHRMGAAYYNNDLELKAIPVYEKALKIRRKLLPPLNYDLSKTLQGYARTLARVRRLEEAIPLLEENIKIREATFSPLSDSLAEAYMIYGGANTESGNYNKAIEYLQKAIVILAHNKRDTVRWSYAYQYLGNAYYFTKQYDDAIKAYNIAISMMQKIGDTKGTSECNHNIGDALAEQKKYTQALPYLEKAQKGYPHSEYLNNIANAYFHLKQYPKAHQYINQALDFAAKNQSLCYYYTPRIYVTLGDILLSENKPSEALTAYNQALYMFLNDNKTPPSELDPLSKIVLNDQAASCRPDILKILMKKGAAFSAALSRHSLIFKLKREKAFQKSQLHNYQVCDTLVREMLTSFTEENSRFFWTENVKTVYENGIKTALDLGEPDIALAFAESSKAFNLLSELQNNRAKRFGGVPDSLISKEKELKTRVAFWQKIALDPAADSSRMAQSRNGLFQAKQDFENFQKQLSKNYPKYAQLKSPPPPLSIADVQKTLKEDMLSIEYFVGDTTLYIFAISKEHCVIPTQKTDASFYQNIADLRRSTGDFKFIKNQPDSAQMLYLHSARELYKTLFSKIEGWGLGIDSPNPQSPTQSQKSRLRIIPDGALGYIPFELLLTDKTDSWRGEKTPWLLQKWAVSYAYSNRLLGLGVEDSGLKSSTLNPQSSTLSGDFGGFGISYDSKKFFFSETEKKNEKIAPLQHTVEEVSNIKNLLGGNAWLDETATKKSFANNAQNCGILHLAMHGFLDAKDPLNSGLIFSRENPSDTTNYLTGYDLYAAQLKAGLAVLSACNTGDGQLRGREGVMSLARSFVFAGCESLVMSLWSVPDKTTSEIMVKFYENLKAGKPKDIALQEAKLYHLTHAEPSRRVPNSWGAMVLIGNVEALTWQAWWQSAWLWGFIGVLAIVFIYFRLKK